MNKRFSWLKHSSSLQKILDILERSGFKLFLTDNKTYYSGLLEKGNVLTPVVNIDLLVIGYPLFRTNYSQEKEILTMKYKICSLLSNSFLLTWDQSPEGFIQVVKEL